jgi:Flp pilus assembly protein TadD
VALAHPDLGRHAEAIKAYEDALRTGWTSADLYSNLGWSYYLLGQPKNALEPFQMAVSLAPDDHTILNLLGVVYARMGRYDEAAKTLRKVLLLKPELALVRYNLGWVYCAKNDRTAALEQYSILKTQAPELGSDLYKRIYRDFLTAAKK